VADGVLTHTMRERRLAMDKEWFDHFVFYVKEMHNDIYEGAKEYADENTDYFKG